ncbi:hypothetical protein JA1_004396 [Spathaspora sp. JA1]|nr:hypothetical protein JA1_004396 [Spathaspora sp. JA1]
MVRVIAKRTLFKSIKEATKKLETVNKQKDKGESFHHEYSIRPDTYAFKVSGSNDTRAITQAKKSSTSSTTAAAPVTFNFIEYIYRYTTNYPFGDKSPQEIYDEYPLTNSEKLSRLINRPKRVKMTTSDFIEDSLYNPNYGYFSKEVEIYQPDLPFEYNNIDDIDEFLNVWQKSYSKYDNTSSKLPATITQQKKNQEVSVFTPKPSKSKYATLAQKIHQSDLQASQQTHSRKSIQLWHTPTELFQPYYGEAIARYILVNYKLNGNYPYNDLIIYEMGGGNGTLMCNILNYIKVNQPDIYARTQYKIIEISSQLVNKQMTSAFKNKLINQGLDSDKLTIYNKSIFKWNKLVDDPCFFIALEVFDNFAHDLIAYDNISGEPYEGKVLIDQHGDFYQFFTKELSYYSNMYLTLRENSSYSMLKQQGKILDKVKAMVKPDKVHPLLHSSKQLEYKHMFFPFKDNLTPGEFIPTRLIEFFQILNHKFPQHSLITSDFNQLPKTIPGAFNSPVVQTVLQDKMIDVSTYMCHQGYFDIMFATDFDLASELYKKLTGKVVRIESHEEFLNQWGDLQATSTKTGENPMVDFYKNVSFMVS